MRAAFERMRLRWGARAFERSQFLDQLDSARYLRSMALLPKARAHAQREVERLEAIGRERGWLD